MGGWGGACFWAWRLGVREPPCPCCILSHGQLAPSFSGTAAIAPIIAAVKDGKSITYEGREVRRPIFMMFRQ